MGMIADRLIQMVRVKRPDLYEAILQRIRPYSLRSVLKVLECHLRHIPDINIFNENIQVVPEFVWTVIKHMKLPTPGDAFGIQVICRVTKSDTQGALDSKHIPAIPNSPNLEFYVEKDILDELALFSNHIQIFELANRHKYATVFMSQDTTLPFLIKQLPHACILERGKEFNKGKNIIGVYRYLASFKYILVEDRGSVKVLYKSLSDLYLILRCVPLKHITAFSDIRCLYKKCGITCTFFNMVQVTRRQLFVNDGSKYEKDVITLLTFMFCRGELLPMNREGLAKTKDRPPIDVLSFEAMKRNCSRLITGPDREIWHTVGSSLECIYCGCQFKEGTGGSFALLNLEEVKKYNLENAPQKLCFGECNPLEFSVCSKRSFGDKKSSVSQI